MTEELVAHVAARDDRAARSSATARRSTSPAVAAGDAARRDPRARRGSTSRSTRDRDALAAAMRERRASRSTPSARWGKLVDELLLEAGRAEARSSPRSCSTIRSSCRRSRSRTARSPDWSSASRPFVGGVEIANAFSELNDPDEQRARFEQQQRLLAAGDEEAQPFDEDYLLRARARHAADRRARHRDRPAGDDADRRHSIREVLLFPALRDR